jgi:hypothetical protein
VDDIIKRLLDFYERHRKWVLLLNANSVVTLWMVLLVRLKR